MKHFLALTLALLLVACPLRGGTMVRGQAVAAQHMATAANAGLPLLREGYAAEGLQCVEDAVDEDEARECIAGVRRRWAPVWRAWDAWSGAHDAWASSLEAGYPGDQSILRGLGSLYCSLEGESAALGVDLDHVTDLVCP